MLKLSASFAIYRSGGPIIWPGNIARGTLIDHRLNGKCNVWFQDAGGFVVAEVHDVWGGVKHGIHAMAAEVAHDTEALPRGDTLNDAADVLDGQAWLTNSDGTL